jgi:hypothetical protein
MTDDDWEPLANDQLCSHPGELSDCKKLPGAPAPVPAAAPFVAAPVVAAVPVAAAVAAPAPAKRAPLTPEQQQLLAELKAKIADNPEAAGILATERKRREKEQRKQRAAVNPALAASAVVRVPGAAPEVAIDEVASDVDARELEPWFRELPPEEQERLRDQWHMLRHRYDDAGKHWRKRMHRSVGYGALVFFALGVLQALLLGGFVYVPILTVYGAIAAGIAELCGGGRFTFSAAGGVAFVATMGVAVFLQPFSLFSLVLACYCMGLVGMDGEMRRSGGFREE